MFLALSSLRGNHNNNGTGGFSKTANKPLNTIESLTGEKTLTSSVVGRELVYECTPLDTSDGHFVDKHGRQVTLKGINLDAMMKLPVKPFLRSIDGNPEDPNDIFFDGDNVSFVGRPFPIEEAEHHISRIKLWGYNTIRYLLTWEAVEHAGPGKYDQEFLDYTVEILRIIHKIGGIYVFMEFHQDVWLRYLGGSGAPLWTFYAAGLEPKRFAFTDAAVLHNQSRFKTESYPKMLWVSNYSKLASLTMFTLFFSGGLYFPDLTINNQNIQDYLQTCFLNTQTVVWKLINDALPEMVANGTLLGVELMNEPNCGLSGRTNLDVLPETVKLRLDTMPTPFQAMKLGMGIACEVDTYKITIGGPQKYGLKLIDPKGISAWMTEEEREIVDKRYGWNRSKWPAGCIYANHGIWDPSSRKLLKTDYFHRPPSPSGNGKRLKVDFEYFVNNQFRNFCVRHKDAVRNVNKEAFVLFQAPVLEIPPYLKLLDLVDLKCVFCPHYYDGMSLLFKTWNTKYNVDTFGIMRDKYLNPVFGLVVGERAIRNCLKSQFLEIRKEITEKVGNVAVLMLETGMPYDMDKKIAFKTGRYYSQTGALDAILWALEGSQLDHTYWTYCLLNQHELGDLWNNEDFSFWLSEDRSDNGAYNFMTLTKLRLKDSIKSVKSNTNGRRKSSRADNLQLPKLSENPSLKTSTTSNNDKQLHKLSQSSTLDTLEVAKDEETSSSENVATIIEEEVFEDENDNATTESTTRSPSRSTSTSKSIACPLILATVKNLHINHLEKCYPSPDGVRAISAIIRPFAVATRGERVKLYFDMKRVIFKLTVTLSSDDLEDNIPSIIYVPKWHYPYLDAGDISVTSGRVEYNDELEYLEWFHKVPEETASHSLIKTESLVIKNLSGLVDEDNPSLFPCAGEMNCPVN